MEHCREGNIENIENLIHINFLTKLILNQKLSHDVLYNLKSVQLFPVQAKNIIMINRASETISAIALNLKMS